MRGPRSHCRRGQQPASGRLRLAIAALALAGGVALTACGDDDDMRTPATQPGATTTVADSMTEGSMMTEDSMMTEGSMMTEESMMTADSTP